MTFLAIIIAVVLLQAWGSAERAHHDGWFEHWRDRVGSWGVGAGLSLVLAVLLPAAVVQLVLNAVEPVLFGLLWLLLAVGLLLYSFGRGDFRASMGGYRGHAFSGDFEAAYLSACEQFGWDPAREAPDSAQQAHAMIQRALVYEEFQRWFAVLFYFALLGPAGALVYRLSQLDLGYPADGSNRRWLLLLDWLPARLLAATFALTGDFIGSRERLLAALGDPAARARDVLYSVGLSALGPEQPAPSGGDAAFGPEAAAQNREFEALLARSAVCWIVVLSLLVLLF